MKTEKRVRDYEGWCDKTKGWGAGPWDDEPDKAHWIDEATGLDCLAVRNMGSGIWCGYVGVPPGHSAHGKDYEEVRELDVHGGLTYANACSGHICHEPEEGRPDNVWWLGFDCGHLGDFSPHSNSFVGHPTLGEFYKEPYDHGFAQKLASADPYQEVYKDFDYVKDECTNLAAQLKEV
jgi:hypothetical protein